MYRPPTAPNMLPMTNHSSSTNRVIADMTMSVDGFIADPQDNIEPLVSWYFAGDTEVAPGVPFRVAAASADLLRTAMGNLGAIVGGRRYFDLANGWGGAHPTGAPVFIVTHSVPAGWENAAPSITFVTEGGIEAALEQAKAAAGDKDVAIATPGTIRQCLELGALDELSINVAPIMLGSGQRFFPGDDLPTIRLEDPEVTVGVGVTHLRYRLADRGAVEAAAVPSGPASA
jgi:dihydrofolate reductase